MSTRLQIRRDSGTNLSAQTPAQGELANNLTTGRLHIGDGATAGGKVIPVFSDCQILIYSGVVSGLAALTGSPTGSRAIVTDALTTPTYMGAPTGGGSHYGSCILLNGVWYYA